jgi:hypothetical protein
MLSLLMVLSRQIERFQARSTYFGVGFTTHKFEKVINNPVRSHAGDELIIYGKLPILCTLDSHRAGVYGDHDHELSVEKKQEAE